MSGARPEDYTLAEMMCIAAARLLPSQGNALAGLGPPILSGVLAKVLYAPDLTFSTEVGAIDWRPDPATATRAPVGIHDELLNVNVALTSDMIESLGTYLMGGNVDVGLLTGAQVDRFGNLNVLCLGPYEQPARRFAGTGGNTEIAGLSGAVVILMPQEPRRFVERCDFITSAGYISGPGARRRAGLRPQGPNYVVSTMGVYQYDTPDGGDSGSCELVLTGVFPNVDPEVVQALVPWPLKLADRIDLVPPPTVEEIRWLRRLDPYRYYLTPGRY